jgi:L-2-hydroxyglutarate oxidase LhgO
VEGLAAIWSPETAIVDFPGVCHALADAITYNGGRVRCDTRVVGIDQDQHGVTLSVDERGHRLVVQCRRAVICAGLHADRLARLAGGSSQPRIIPFRGEYYALTPEHRHLVNGLVYPVPDPRYPFLGIHLTKHVDGSVLIGPNAILALAREGYRRRDLRIRELFGTLTDHGFRAMARQHWRTGAAELASSLVRRVFVARAQKYLPELSARMVVRAQAGVRAQAIDRSGHLIDDFVIEDLGRVLAVRNAPSPAATSSLAIARHLVELMYSSK